MKYSNCSSISNVHIVNISYVINTPHKIRKVFLFYHKKIFHLFLCSFSKWCFQCPLLFFHHYWTLSNVHEANYLFLVTIATKEGFEQFLHVKEPLLLNNSPYIRRKERSVFAFMLFMGNSREKLYLLNFLLFKGVRLQIGSVLFYKTFGICIHWHFSILNLD